MARPKENFEYSPSRIDYIPDSNPDFRRDPEDEEIKEWVKCAANPAYFIHNYCFIQDPVRGKLPFLLYIFQRAVLKQLLMFVFNIILKPRQMGLSWLVAAFSLWFAMFRSDKTVEVISIKEETSKRFMDKIKYIYIHLPPWLKGELESQNTLTMVFRSHSRIMSVPTSEEAGRSEGLSLLIIDEAAFVRWIGKIWGAAFPTLSTGGMAILISTANGMGNFFANKWQDAVAAVSDFNPIRLHWRMHPDRDDEWYRRQRRELGPALCAQEVDCDFLNSGRPVFDAAIIVEWAEILRHLKPLKVLYAPEVFDDYEGLYGKKAEGLYIFKKPQKGKSYVLGQDAASGDGTDYHAFQVVDWETGEQVAEARFQCKPDRACAYGFALGKFYNWALVVPERNGVGLAVVQKYIERNYPNLYTYMKEDASIDPDISTKSLVTQETLLVGFTTTVANRPVLIDLGEELMRTHDELRQQSAVPRDSLLVYGLRTLNEMLVFNFQETGKPNPRANDGFNDDLVMAWLIAQLARARYKPRREMPVIFT